MRLQKTALVISLVMSCALAALAQSKPKLTLDEFFNSVSFPSIAISPDGNSVVIAVERADWDQQIFRSDLWLYHDDGKGGSSMGNLIQLTQSGHDSEPQWSPDGNWIAFLSERKSSAEKGSDSDSDADSKDESASQIYLISPTGGEAFPITQGEEDVHSVSWSADSRTIYFSTRQPWTKAQKDAYKNDWKDIVQYRTAERGDVIFALDLSTALARHTAAPTKAEKKEGEPEEQPDLTPGAHAIAGSPLRVEGLVTSPDGRKLAFLSNAINQRQEKYEDVEIYVVDLTVIQPPSPERKYASFTAEPRRITHNQAEEVHPRWADDSRHIFFSVEVGDVAGPYRDVQPHLYWVDTESGATEHDQTEQWSKDFIGPVDHYAIAANTVLTSARLGTEVQMYSAAKPSDSLHRVSHWPGTFANISTAAHSPKVAFLYSSLGKPEEVYLADSADKLDQAKPITQFNKLFTERDLPQGQALPVEGRRRHDGRRHADLSSRQI